MRIVVSVNCLGFKTSDSIKLLDGCSTKPGQCAKDSTFDLSDLGVFYSVHQGILSLGSMILEFFGCVFFAKRCNLVEVHLQVVRHLFRKLILWSPGPRKRQEEKESSSKLH